MIFQFQGHLIGLLTRTSLKLVQLNCIFIQEILYTLIAPTLLGYVGSTGTSSGAHLHLDVNTVGAYYGGTNSNNVNKDTTINPVTLFPQISFD